MSSSCPPLFTVVVQLAAHTATRLNTPGVRTSRWMPVLAARLFALSLSVRVFVTGATGFIGRALVPRLQRNGHSVVVWARSDTRAMALLGADVDVVSTTAGQDALVAALRDCDAVINLAGEPLF